YSTIENNGIPVTQRTTINLSSLLTASDVGGKTAITVNEANLDLANIGGLLDLSTQVTGLLDVSNIDVNSLANDTTFIDALVANAYFTSELATDSNFITELTNNATFI